MISERPFLPEQPIEVGKQIELSFKLWIAALATCFWPLLIPSLLTVLPHLLFAPSPTPESDPLAFDFEAFTRPSYWMLWAALFAVSVLGQVVALRRLQALAAQQSESFGRSVELALSRLPAALGGYLLYLLALTLSLLPWIAHIVWQVNQPFSMPAAGLLVLSTCLLWIFPTWFSLAAVFFLFASGLDKAGPIEGIRRSLQLMRGHWWRTSAVVGVILLAYSGILGVAMPLCLSIAVGVSYAMHGAEAFLTLQWLPGFELLFAPVQAISLSLIFATGWICYRDLVIRHQQNSSR